MLCQAFVISSSLCWYISQIYWSYACWELACCSYCSFNRLDFLFVSVKLSSIFFIVLIVCWSSDNDLLFSRLASSPISWDLSTFDEDLDPIYLLSITSSNSTLILLSFSPISTGKPYAPFLCYYWLINSTYWLWSTCIFCASLFINSLSRFIFRFYFWSYWLFKLISLCFWSSFFVSSLIERRNSRSSAFSFLIR